MSDKITVSRNVLVNGIALMIRNDPALALGLTSPHQSDRESAVKDIGITVDKLFRLAKPVESEVESDGFIKCSDRLPEKSGDYCVTIVSRFSGHEGERYVEHSIMFEAEFEPRWMSDEMVIAWREPVEPYAGEP